jgi:hypothetical protein
MFLVEIRGQIRDLDHSILRGLSSGENRAGRVMSGLATIRLERWSISNSLAI